MGSDPEVTGQGQQSMAQPILQRPGYLNLIEKAQLLEELQLPVLKIVNVLQPSRGDPAGFYFQHQSTACIMCISLADTSFSSLNSKGPFKLAYASSGAMVGALILPLLPAVLKVQNPCVISKKLWAL